MLLATMLGKACGGPDIAAPAASNPGDVVWSAEASDLNYTPVADSSRVYFGSQESQVTAVDVRTGKTLWKQTIAVPGGGLLGFSFGSVLVLAGDVLVVPNGYVYGFDRASGALRWTFKGTFGTAPGWDFLSTDGTTIYAGGPPAGRLYAIDAATGLARWDVSVATDTVQTTAFNPVVYRDTVYVGVWRQTNLISGGVAAVDARTGRKLWYTELPASAAHRYGGTKGRAAFAGRLVVVAVGDGQIAGLDRGTGHVEWIAPQPVELVSGQSDDREVAVVGGVVVATSTTVAIYGYDAVTGAVLWKRVLREASFTGLSTDDSSAYVALAGGALVALDARTGSTRWTWGHLVPGPDPSDKALGRPGVDRDFVYIPGVKKGYKVRK